MRPYYKTRHRELLAAARGRRGAGNGRT
jgi:hypothetical protein